MILRALLITGMLLSFSGVVLADETPDSYIACGCGCCAVDEASMDRPVTCVKSREELQRLINIDKNFLDGHPDICAAAGCSMGQKYALCNQPATNKPASKPTTAVIVIHKKPFFGLR